MTSDDYWGYEGDADLLLDAGADMDGFEALDELAALDDQEAFDELAELDGFDDSDELELLDDDSFLDDLDDAALDDEDALSDYAMHPSSGLYLPRQPTLVTGPAAIAAARRLNPVVIESLRADDADAFFRRIRRLARRVGGLVRRVGSIPLVRRIGRVAGGLLRRAAPLLLRAMPAIQRIVGFAGPFGRLAAAGIGAVRGLASGGGWRGALAGAIGGAVPGIGGRIASMVLRGNGADDDAALDALADMTDAGQVPAAVALPIGAGLAARVATRQGLERQGTATQAVARAWPAARAAERVFLSSLANLPGSAGQRLRLLNLAARAAALRVGQQPGVRVAAQAIPSAARTAARQVMVTARRMPRLGAITRSLAIRRLLLRQRLLRQWFSQLGMPLRGLAPAFA